jgi:hypothetical protein
MLKDANVEKQHSEVATKIQVCPGLKNYKNINM